MPPPKAIRFFPVAQGVFARAQICSTQTPAEEAKLGTLTILNLRCQVQGGAPPEKCGIQEIKNTVIKLGVAEQLLDAASNLACTELLGGLLGVPRTYIRILSGYDSRIKEFRVTGKTGKYWGSQKGVQALLQGKREAEFEVVVRRMETDRSSLI